MIQQFQSQAVESVHYVSHKLQVMQIHVTVTQVSQLETKTHSSLLYVQYAGT